MPNIRSSKKKMRQDKKQTKRNAAYDSAILNIMKQVKKSKTGKEKTELVAKAYSAIDKAAKKKVIHKNKAARLKSNVSRLTKKK